MFGEMKINWFPKSDEEKAKKEYEKLVKKYGKDSILIKEVE
ncbi:hypothetical protein [Senegalia massiliensis]|nr:hypothetical protein [Senegalia massiliensis]